MSLKWVGIVSLVFFLLIVAWDIFLKIDEDSKTISHGSRWMTRSFVWWPILLSVGVGVLSGHFALSDWQDAGECKLWCD